MQATSLEDQAFELLDSYQTDIDRIAEFGLADDFSDDSLARDLARISKAFMLLRHARHEYEIQAIEEGFG